MFIDYYQILEIPLTSTSDEIKIAFRNQAIKWHPDRNPGIDTTHRMQIINEAYLILKDPEARLKYDVEYLKFKEFSRGNHFEKKSDLKNDFKSEYEFYDEVLKRWVLNARNQSIELARQTIRDFKGMAKVGLKEGYKASKGVFIYYVIISIIILFLTKTCNQ
jgi:curved DNA-binding protein CbpA